MDSTLQKSVFLTNLISLVVLDQQNEGTWKNGLTKLGEISSAEQWSRGLVWTITGCISPSVGRGSLCLEKWDVFCRGACWLPFPNGSCVNTGNYLPFLTALAV